MITFGKFDFTNYQDCFVVTDANVANLYNISGDNVYLLPQGEIAKTFDNVQKLCSWLLEKNATKQSKIVAVGGGSVGDTVGFLSTIYKRGVSLLHVPTTLVAQIDSSIGGKTALNVDGVKNAVGTFFQADTLIDTRFLQTLDKTQLLNGKGELVKYCMLSNSIEELYSQGDVDKIIEACALYKSEICNQDMFDQHLRHKLNAGHTIGHAMELLYNVPHGQAVANGLYYETILAHKLQLCTADYCKKWQDTIQKDFEILPLTQQVLQQITHDKKNNLQGIGFCLPSEFVNVNLKYEQVCKLLLD